MGALTQKRRALVIVLVKVQPETDGMLKSNSLKEFNKGIVYKGVSMV